MASLWLHDPAKHEGDRRLMDPVPIEVHGQAVTAWECGEHRLLGAPEGLRDGSGAAGRHQAVEVPFDQQSRDGNVRHALGRLPRRGGTDSCRRWPSEAANSGALRARESPGRAD